MAVWIQRVETLRRERPAAAWVLLRRRFKSAQRQADPGQRAALWRLRGHVLRRLRRIPEALAAYRRAERKYAEIGDPREQGRCAIGIVDALMYLGRYEEALRAARVGRHRLRHARDPGALARLANNEANVLHRLDRPGQALNGYRRARTWLTRARDPRGAALVEGNVANCLSLLGRLTSARSLYQHAAATLNDLGHPLDALNADYNLAYLEFLDHHYDRALSELARVGAEARERGSPSLAALAALDRAEILLRTGRPREALAEALRAEEALEPLGLAYERAKAWTFAALAEHRLGRWVSARSRLEAALAVFHAEANEVWAGEVLVGLATVWWREGNPGAAMPLLASAGRRFAHARDHERQGFAIALLARARLAIGDRRGARAALQRIRRLRRAPSPRLRHVILAARAAMARAEGRTGEARRYLHRAAAESERLAARILDEHWRSSFWGEWGWPHQELAALELAAGRATESFESLETGRGRTLIGGFTRLQEPTTSVPAAARRWAAARMARDRHRAATVAGPGVSLAESPGTTAPGRLRRLLDRPVTSPIRASEVQRGLSADTLLLDYLLHEGELASLAVTRGGVCGHPGLIRERRLTEQVHALLFDLRGALLADRDARGVDSMNHLLTELSAAILWPALERTEALPRTLAVVPVGPLARLPWAALKLPDGRALCEAMEVRVVPGLRLGLTGHPRAPAAGPPLIVASAVEDLEQVGPEARALLAAFPNARLIEGAEATADRFLSLAPAAEWIHFAGHGLFRPDRPQESALRFGDRWLTAGELAGLRLAASWVTLSACETARSLLQPGEEWFGLVRSFLLRGTQVVLASQWDVEDRATADLMAEIYGLVAAGRTISGALRETQARRQVAGQHPVEWAGFVALGGPQTASRISALQIPTS